MYYCIDAIVKRLMTFEGVVHGGSTDVTMKLGRGCLPGYSSVGYVISRSDAYSVCTQKVQVQSLETENLYSGFHPP